MILLLKAPQLDTSELAILGILNHCLFLLELEADDLSYLLSHRSLGARHFLPRMV